MNMNKLKLALATVLLCAGLPLTASAFETTSQTATLVAPNTILYTVSYTLGFLNRETVTPIAALRAGMESDFFHTEYTLQNETAVVPSGTSNAIVLSSDEDIEIKDGAYYLPEGRSAEFTLVSLFTFPTNETAHITQTALQITDLPFILVEDGEETLSGISTQLLADYRTPTVKAQETIAITNVTYTSEYNPNMK